MKNVVARVRRWALAPFLVLSLAGTALGQSITPLGLNASDSGAVTVTANASTDTKGSYAEIVASTAEDYDCFFLKFARTSDITDIALDLATGAASSEVDFVNDILISGQRANTETWFFFPIPIASGSRVSARIASSRSGSATAEVALYGLEGTALSNIALTGTAGVDTHGFNASDTGGVQVDPGGTANTEGSYSEIVASTSNTSKFLGIAIGAQDNFNMADGNFHLDIATGGAGSETVVIENLQFSELGSVSDVFAPSFFFVPIEIASGSRIAARAQSDITDATDRLFDVVVYVFYGTLPTVGGGGGTSMHPNKRGGKQN